MASASKIQPFTPLRTSDPILSRVQTQVQQLAQVLTEIPLLNGRLIQDVDLTTSESLVEHGLDRVPTGWFVVGIDANATVYSASTPTLPKRHLPLTASATCTVSLWVF
jgi:hypothetical protein